MSSRNNATTSDDVALHQLLSVLSQLGICVQKDDATDELYYEVEFNTIPNHDFK